MTVEQIYALMNDVTGEILGETGLVAEDLSNVVDLGDTIVNTAGMDKYVRSLIDHIGKVVFVNRAYTGNTPSVLMDGWEYGAILEKVTYDELPEATENETWDLTDQQVYEQDTFYKPKVSAKFFQNKTTFEIPMSFAERQVKSAFDNVGQLNAFFSMIENAIQSSMTVKTDALVERTINNMIAETLGDTSDSNLNRKVNLLSMYNTKFSESLTADQAITTPEFIRFAAYMMGIYSKRLTKMSSLFNIGGKPRFTPKDRQHIILLSEFEQAAGVYLESDTFHNEFVKLPKAESVPYWQGSGTGYAFEATSKVKVTSSGGKSVDQGGIIGVMFDRYALGVANGLVANIDRRVTTHYNAKAEFFNNWYKADEGHFNDLNENFVVFYLQ